MAQLSTVETDVVQLNGVCQPRVDPLQQLRLNVHRLRFAVARAVAAGDITDRIVTQEIDSALANADRELAQSQPTCRKVVAGLSQASTLLHKSAISTPNPALPRLAATATTTCVSAIELLET